MLNDYWIIILAISIMDFIAYQYGVRGKYLLVLPITLAIIIFAGGSLLLASVGICFASFWLSKRVKK